MHAANNKYVILSFPFKKWVQWQDKCALINFNHKFSTCADYEKVATIIDKKKSNKN